MDTGSNRAAAPDERRVDRRSQGADLGLPGRIRPVERPADHRGDQERHQPVPRLGLRRRAQLRVEREQQGQHPERRSRRPSRRRRIWGYSIGGPIGKPGGTNKLFFFYSQEFSPRTGGNDVQRFRVPTAAERAGDFSQTLDNNGALYNLTSRIRCCAGACTATDTSGCFRGRRRRRQDSAEPPVPDRAEHPEACTRCRTSGVPGARTTTTRSRGPRKTRSHYAAGRPRRLPADARSCASRGKYSGWQQRRELINGLAPGLQRHADAAPGHQQPGVLGATTTSANTMFLEGTYGRSRNELAGCALAQSGTGPIFCTAAVPMNDELEPRQRRARRICRCSSRTPTSSIPSYYADQALNGMNPAPPGWVNGDFVKPPTFAWGSRIGQRAAEHPVPGYFNVNATQDVSISLTKVARPPHAQDRLLQHPQLQGGAGAPAPTRSARSASRRTRGTNAFDTSFGFANAAIGIVQLLQPGVEVRRRQLRLRQPRGLRAGQLEGEQPADARLRHALRPCAAAVRQARAGHATSCPTSGRARRRRSSTGRAARSRSRRARPARRRASRR